MSDAGRRLATAAVLRQVGATAGMTDASITQLLADLVGEAPRAQGLDRRAFLQVLGLGAAGVAAALWVPGQKTLILPPVRTVVGATVGDLRALRAAFPGPFLTSWRAPVTFGQLDPTRALQVLSDQEYALVVARGRRILAGRTRESRPSAPSKCGGSIRAIGRAGKRWPAAEWNSKCRSADRSGISWTATRTAFAWCRAWTRPSTVPPKGSRFRCARCGRCESSHE